jgi:antitoxin ParD1/3/4
MASIALGPHFEAFVKAQLESGRYNNASEVVRAGLRLLEDATLDREQKLKALDEALAKGLADAEAGRMIPLEEVVDRLTAKYAALAQKRSA